MTTATSSCRSASTPEAGREGGAWAARRLEVADVRCWHRAEIELPGGLTLVVGPNGAGKTSLVEAVTLGCLGISPRTAREAEVVRRGAEALHVTLELDGPTGMHRREIGFAPGRGRRLRLDGEPVRSLASWRARAVLVFLPDELRAVKGPPAARRRALDRVLEAADPGVRRGRGGLSGGAGPAQRAAAAHPCGRGVRGQPEGLGGAHGRTRGRGGRGAPRRRRGPGEPFRHWLGALGGGPGGALGLETSPPASPTWPTTPSRRASRRPCASAGPATCRPRRPPRAPTGTTSSWPPAPRTSAAGAARASSARPRSRCSWPRGTSCAPARLGPSSCSTTCSASSTPAGRRLLLEAVRDGGQTLVTSADPAAADALSDPPDALVRVEAGTLW